MNKLIKETTKICKETAVKFPSGKVVNYPKHTSLVTLLDDSEFKDMNVVGFLVNKNLFSLHHSLFVSKAEIKPITLENDDAATFIYLASYMFLFGMVVDQEFDSKKHTLTAEHQLGQGYFLEISNFDKKFSQQFTDGLKEKMDSLISQDLVIHEEHIIFQDAIEYFGNQKHQNYACELIKSKNDSEVHVNSCNDYYQLFCTPLVYSTGILPIDYQITPHDHGILFTYPKKLDLHNIDYFNQSLIPLYRESNEWGEKLDLDCAGKLNNAIHENSGKKIKHFITLCHAKHLQKISEIATDYMSNYQKNSNFRLILIAGPSASGKTTFATTLCNQLETRGMKPLMLSVDDYFKPHSEMKFNDDGSLDFDDISSIRIDLLNQHLGELMEGKTVKAPIYDFKEGKPRELQFREMKLQSKDSMIVMEGIHCLNEKLTAKIDSDNKYKIFASAFSQLNIDEKRFVSNSTNRLCRRLVRDFKYRGSSPQQTFTQWKSVRRSEHKYIFPYMYSNSNFILN
eukprot:gene2985-4995_t